MAAGDTSSPPSEDADIPRCHGGEGWTPGQPRTEHVGGTNAHINTQYHVTDTEETCAKGGMQGRVGFHVLTD